MRKFLLTATALGALAAAPPASAGLLAQYSTTGGAPFTFICSDVSGGTCSSSFTASDGLVFVVFGANSNSPGTPADANLLSTTLRISNPTATAQTILLSIGDTGFTEPTSPPGTILINNLAGTVLTGGTGQQGTSIACVNGSNAQNSCTGGIITPLITANLSAAGVGDATTTAGVSTLAAPYSMTELITFTVAAGGLLNYTSSTDLRPAPEPASLTLMGVGLLGLGMVSLRKRNS